MNPYECQLNTPSISPNMILTVAINQGFNPNPLNPLNPIFNPTQQYIIESCIKSDRVLDISQDDKNYGQLIIWKKHGKRNQRFRIVPRNGRYVIVSCFGMSLLTAGKDCQGAGIFMHFGEGFQGEFWEFQYVNQKPNTFYIKNGHHKYMDVFQQNSKKGTPVIQWKYNGKKNQMWRITPI